MAAVSDQDVIARFGALNISAPKVIEHAAVKGVAEWRAELDKLGKTGVAITKTVRGLPRPTARRGAFIDTTHSSLQPKTAKTAEPTPVLVVAKEDTETSSALIGNLLKLKELRLANEDLIKQVIPSAASKDDGG
jgi:prolyl-tRNA synthetase